MPRASARTIALHLRRADPHLEEVIRRTGVRRPYRAPPGFGALVRAIIYQQISGAAGSAILRRVIEAGGAGGIPEPPWFEKAPDALLRGAGVSPQKIRYLRDLAEEVVSGRLRFAELAVLGDDEVIEVLTRVRGIGRWTAQMYLLFNLGRPDVLPTGDLGLRRAVQRLHGLRAPPAESTLLRIGRRWAPYRSHATFYLWRSLELDDSRADRSRAILLPVTGASRRTATPRARPRRSR